jgi:hypothetical protein
MKWAVEAQVVPPSSYSARISACSTTPSCNGKAERSHSTCARQDRRRRGGIGHGAVPLIFLNVGTEQRPYRYGMTDAASSEDRFLPCLRRADAAADHDQERLR